jgi:hypothetical protein
MEPTENGEGKKNDEYLLGLTGLQWGVIGMLITVFFGLLAFVFLACQFLGTMPGF